MTPRASRSERELHLDWPGEGPQTSEFGDGRNHPGIDVDAETGDPVLAAAGGVVTIAGEAPTGYGGYGLTVGIDHGRGGLSTLYAHLSSIAVAVGEVVAPGQVLGAAGTTGVATGSHIHFEVRLNGVPVDPQPWLPPHERLLL